MSFPAGSLRYAAHCGVCGPGGRPGARNNRPGFRAKSPSLGRRLSAAPTLQVRQGVGEKGESQLLPEVRRSRGESLQRVQSERQNSAKAQMVLRRPGQAKAPVAG